MILTEKGHEVQTGSIRAIFWVYYQAALMFKDYKMFAYAVPPTGYLDPKLASWYALVVPSAICYYQGRLHLAIAGIVTMLGMIIFRRSSSSLFMFLWLSIFSAIYAAVTLFIVAPHAILVSSLPVLLHQLSPSTRDSTFYVLAESFCMTLGLLWF